MAGEGFNLLDGLDALDKGAAKLGSIAGSIKGIFTSENSQPIIQGQDGKPEVATAPIDNNKVLSAGFPISSTALIIGGVLVAVLLIILMVKK